MKRMHKILSFCLARTHYFSELCLVGALIHTLKGKVCASVISRSVALVCHLRMCTGEQFGLGLYIY